MPESPTAVVDDQAAAARARAVANVRLGWLLGAVALLLYLTIIVKLA